MYKESGELRKMLILQKIHKMGWDMAKKDNLETIKVIAGIAKNIAKISWPCMAPGCSQKAINSHLLQRHGVLSHIVENGHCYEVKVKDFFKWSADSQPVEFKLIK